MVTTITTDLDPVPSRSAPSTFSERMDTWLGKISTWTTEANAVATAVNSDAVDAEEAKDAAEAAEILAEAHANTAAGYITTAAAYANYQGNWSGLTGALNKPASVYHDSIYWLLNTDLADVTASEPDVSNTDWSKISGEYVFETDTQTLTNKTLTDPEINGCIKEEIYTITDGAAFEIDPSNGGLQLITLGASRTPKATNFANGEAIVLMIDDGSAYTLTMTDATFGGSGVVWKTDGGEAPLLNLTGYTAIVLWKAGNQVYGARVGDN